jgi:hypothetical protein
LVGCKGTEENPLKIDDKVYAIVLDHGEYKLIDATIKGVKNVNDVLTYSVVDNNDWFGRYDIPYSEVYTDYNKAVRRLQVMKTPPDSN